MSGTIELTFRAELVPLDGHDRLVSAVPGPNGNMTALWVTAYGERRMSSTDGGGQRPAGVLDEPVSAMVVEYAPDVRTVVAIPDLFLAHPTTQPLPDGGVLVAGARSRWRPPPDGPEPNAAVYGPDGRLVRAGLLGDGIEHLQVSSDGRIWVGYFDEGVLGNHGWGRKGRRPIGAPGVVGFDSELLPERQLPEGHVLDCYALNVDRDAVWVCGHSDFSILRLADGRTTRWANDVRYAHALVVAGDRLALIGGYGDDTDRVAIGVLGDHVFQVEQVSRLTMPGGARPRNVSLHGRGRTLHVIEHQTWYVTTLEP